MDDVVLFSECSIDDAKVIGKKAAHLAELYAKGFTIPPGFVITGNLFVKFIEMTGLKERIAEILINSMEFEQKAVQIQQIILNTPFPQEMAQFIYQSYTSLAGQQSSEGSNEPYVALRVSSTSDFIDDAFFLNIKGKDRLINGLKSCWASLFNAKNLPLKRFKPSVIVQRMANPVKSGFAYSQNPITGNPNEIVVAVSSGLANVITLHQSIPSLYVIDKENYTVKHAVLKDQQVEYVLSLQKERTEKVELQEPVKNILDDYVLQEVAKLATKVEARLNLAVRVAFTIEKQVSVVGAKAIDREDFKKRYADHFFTDELLGTMPKLDEDPMQQAPAQHHVPEQQEQAPMYYDSGSQQQAPPSQDQMQQQGFQQPRQEQPAHAPLFTPRETPLRNEAEPQHNVQQPAQESMYDPEESQDSSYQKEPAQEQPVQEPMQQTFWQQPEPQQEEQTDSSFIQFQDQYAMPQEPRQNEQPVQESQQEQAHEQAKKTQTFDDVDDGVFAHYEPEVHYQNEADEETDPQQQQSMPEPQHVQSQEIRQPVQQPVSTQSREEFMGQHMSQDKKAFHDIMFSASTIVASCDVAVISALKRKYRSIYNTDAPEQFGRLLNELKIRMDVPYERELIVIRKLRDDFLNSGRTLSPKEIEYCLNYTKQFLDAM